MEYSDDSYTYESDESDQDHPPTIDPIPPLNSLFSSNKISSPPSFHHNFHPINEKTQENEYVQLNYDVLGVIFSFALYGFHKIGSDRVPSKSSKTDAVASNKTYSNWCSFRSVSKEWREGIDRIYVFPLICLEKSIINGNESVFFYLLNKNGIQLRKFTIKAGSKSFSPFRGKSENCNNLLVIAASRGNIKIFNHLLKQDENIGVQNNLAFRWTCSEGHHQMVRLLLQNKKVDPTSEKNQAFQAAAFRGRDSVVNLLLKDVRINPADNEDLAICSVVSIYAAFPVNPDAKPDEMPEGNQRVLMMLLDDSRINPGARNNLPLRDACRNGWAEAVQLLLERSIEDPRVNPAANDCEALWDACEGGHVEVVKLLLGHEKVEPKAKNYRAYMVACSYGNVTILKLLLEKYEPSTKKMKEMLKETERKGKILASNFLKERMGIQDEPQEKVPDSACILS